MTASVAASPMMSIPDTGGAAGKAAAATPDFISPFSTMLAQLDEAPDASASETASVPGSQEPAPAVPTPDALAAATANPLPWMTQLDTARMLLLKTNVTTQSNAQSTPNFPQGGNALPIQTQIAEPPRVASSPSAVGNAPQASAANVAADEPTIEDVVAAANAPAEPPAQVDPAQPVPVATQAKEPVSRPADEKLRLVAEDSTPLVVPNVVALTEFSSPVATQFLATPAPAAPQPTSAWDSATKSEAENSLTASGGQVIAAQPVAPAKSANTPNTPVAGTGDVGTPNSVDSAPAPAKASPGPDRIGDADPSEGPRDARASVSSDPSPAVPNTPSATARAASTSAPQAQTRDARASVSVESTPVSAQPIADPRLASGTGDARTAISTDALPAKTGRTPGQTIGDTAPPAYVRDANVAPIANSTSDLGNTTSPQGNVIGDPAPLTDERNTRTPPVAESTRDLAKTAGMVSSVIGDVAPLADARNTHAAPTTDSAGTSAKTFSAPDRNSGDAPPPANNHDARAVNLMDSAPANPSTNDTPDRIASAPVPVDHSVKSEPSAAAPAPLQSAPEISTVPNHAGLDLGTGTLSNPPPAASSDVNTPVRISFSAPGVPDTSAFDSLALKIATRSSNGERNFTLRLDPPELGRIEVNLNVRSDGHAQAELSADRPQTLELLQRDASSLERALKDSGINLAAGLAFSLKGEGRSQAWRDTQSDSRARSLQIAAADAAIANSGIVSATALSGLAYGPSSARLDIRV
jgi:flagellar hook-length control protein FliK